MRRAVSHVARFWVATIRIACHKSSGLDVGARDTDLVLCAEVKSENSSVHHKKNFKQMNEISSVFLSASGDVAVTDDGK